MSDSPRLDRIEQIVINLEADMKIMASSVSSLAVSMEKFVEMQTDHKLLKQEMKINCDYVHTKLRSFDIERTDIKKDIEDCKEHYRTEIQERFRILEPIVMLVKYPKVALMGVALLYLMAIKEVREVVLPFI